VETRQKPIQTGPNPPTTDNTHPRPQSTPSQPGYQHKPHTHHQNENSRRGCSSMSTSSLLHEPATPTSSRTTKKGPHRDGLTKPMSAHAKQSTHREQDWQLQFWITITIWCLGRSWRATARDSNGDVGFAAGGDRSMLKRFRRRPLHIGQYMWSSLSYLCHRLPEAQTHCYYKGLRLGYRWSTETLLLADIPEVVSHLEKDKRIMEIITRRQDQILQRRTRSVQDLHQLLPAMARQVHPFRVSCQATGSTWQTRHL
jgi:hypothetical protein